MEKTWANLCGNVNKNREIDEPNVMKCCSKTPPRETGTANDAYFERINRMPKVPGPQWQETVQPAWVSMMSVKGAHS